MNLARHDGREACWGFLSLFFCPRAKRSGNFLTNTVDFSPKVARVFRIGVLTAGVVGKEGLFSEGEEGNDEG
jgi:hypothetical protein